MAEVEIQGENGKFEVDIDEATPGPDTIKITYTPKKNEKGCKNIRLTQVAKAEGYDTDGKKVADRDEKIDDPPDFYKHARDDRTICGYLVDHVECEGDPFYNGDDTPHDTSSKGDATKTPPDPTKMDDDPSCPVPDTVQNGIAKVVYRFETCAICVDNGKILDCFTWKMEADASDSGKITVQREKRAKRPSLDFRLALKKFIRKHSKKDPNEANGPVRWYCPDTSDSVEGPDGNYSDPYGNPIPKGFAKRWICIYRRLFMAFGEIMKERVPGIDIAIAREQAGGGLLYDNVSKAIEAGLQDPKLCAVKFTWSGKQRKIRKGIVLTPLEGIQARHIAPFVNDEPRFNNDFYALEAFLVSEGQIKNMLEMVTELMVPIEQGKGPNTVSIITKLDTEEARAFTGTMNREQVADFARRAARFKETDQLLLEVLHYLGQNFGNL